MSTRTKLLTTMAAAILAGGVSAQALGAPGAERGDARELKLLDRPVEHLKRSIDVHERREARLERRREARREAAEPEYQAPESFGVSQATLEAIASCESGGNPTAVSADGTYRGKYQFDAGTWAAMGGSGDPAAAPEAEQDMRAAMLYAQSGASPWPVCGA